MFADLLAKVEIVTILCLTFEKHFLYCTNVVDSWNALTRVGTKCADSLGV